MNEINTKIKNLISKQVGIDVNSINDTDCIVADLNADSLDTLEIVMDLEREFNVELEDSDISCVTKINDIANLINTKVSN